MPERKAGPERTVWGLQMVTRLPEVQERMGESELQWLRKQLVHGGVATVGAKTREEAAAEGGMGDLETLSL